MRNLALLLIFLGASLSAQIPSVNDIEFVISPSFFPCEQGDADIFSILCPPFEGQGVMVHLRTSDTGAAGFRVTVFYADRDGVERSASAVVGRKPSGFTQAVVLTGRVRTPQLSGVKIVRVTFEKLYAAPAVTAEVQ